MVIKPAGIASFALKHPPEGCYNERDEAAAHIPGCPAGGYWIAPLDLLKFGEWIAKECKDPSTYELVKKYGREFQPERQQVKKGEEENFNPEELSHGGAIDSSTAFLGTFLPNGMTVAILSNRPHQAAVLEGAIKERILSKKE